MINNNNQEQDERASRHASQSKSNKRDMGNSAPVDLKELKTLKDLNLDFKDERIIKSQIKAEVIKWVKEDKKNTPTRNEDAWELILKWMKRLDITEEDLK